MKYQIGEVVRFADTEHNRANGLVNKLATITQVLQNSDWYLTAITDDKWIHKRELVSVNGGMLQQASDCISRAAALAAIHKDPMGGMNYESILANLPAAIYKSETESTSDSIGVDEVTHIISAMDDDSFGCLRQWMDKEQYRRDVAADERRNLIEDVCGCLENCKAAQHLFSDAELIMFGGMLDALDKHFTEGETE